MTFLLGSFLGILVGGMWLARKRMDAQTAMPYGVFLAPAAMVVVIAGPQIWHWYLALGA